MLQDIDDHLMTTRPVFRFLAALLFCAMSASVHAASLPPSVRQALDSARIPASSVAVWVQAVDAPAPQLEAGG